MTLGHRRWTAEQRGDLDTSRLRGAEGSGLSPGGLEPRGSPSLAGRVGSAHTRPAVAVGGPLAAVLAAFSPSCGSWSAINAWSCVCALTSGCSRIGHSSVDAAISCWHVSVGLLIGCFAARMVPAGTASLRQGGAAVSRLGEAAIRVSPGFLAWPGRASCCVDGGIQSLSHVRPASSGRGGAVNRIVGGGINIQWQFVSRSPRNMAAKWRVFWVRGNSVDEDGASCSFEWKAASRSGGGVWWENARCTS